MSIHSCKSDDQLNLSLEVRNLIEFLFINSSSIVHPTNPTTTVEEEEERGRVVVTIEWR